MQKVQLHKILFYINTILHSIK